MAMMSCPGRSELTGYFDQEKPKRKCPIRQIDGSTVGWAPPAHARWKKPTSTVSNDFVSRSSKGHKAWDRGFSFLDAEAFLANPSQIENGSGVYALFVRGGPEILDSSDFTPDPFQIMWVRDDATHLYTGESYALRNRILDHLLGDCMKSNFRESLLALQWTTQSLPDGPSIHSEAEAVENALTEWLRPRVVVGFKRCGYIRDVEEVILKATASPLNIVGRNAAPYARRLLSMRLKFRTEVRDAWPKIRPAVDQVRH